MKEGRWSRKHWLEFSQYESTASESDGLERCTRICHLFGCDVFPGAEPRTSRVASAVSLAPRARRSVRVVLGRVVQDSVAAVRPRGLEVSAPRASDREPQDTDRAVAVLAPRERVALARLEATPSSWVPSTDRSSMKSSSAT